MTFMNLFRLAAIMALCLPAASLAADGPADSSSDSLARLDPLTVVAHRQPRQLSEVAGTVTVIDANRLDRDMVFDAADLIRYEPGMAIDNEIGRASCRERVRSWDEAQATEQK